MNCTHEYLVAIPYNRGCSHELQWRAVPVQYHLWWSDAKFVGLMDGGIYPTHEAAVAAIPEVRQEFADEMSAGDASWVDDGTWKIEKEPK